MKMMGRKRIFYLIGFILTAAGLLATSVLISSPASAQVFYFTPTAEANGNVYYIVKEGETCDSIALVNNVSVETLRTQNKLDFDQCRFLQVGQKLLLATIPTPIVTAGPSPTPTSLIPTPEPLKGTGTICVYLYDDINGDAMVSDTEGPLADGAISVSSQAGDFSSVGTSVNTGDPVCFENIPEGEYNISVAIPEGYNPTSGQNRTIQLKAGDISTINFSAQVSGRVTTTNGGGGGGSVLLAIFGGFILLAGIGVGLYARYILRAK